MMKLNFNKAQKDGLYIYTHVHNAGYESMAAFDNQPLSFPDKKAINDISYSQIFNDYIAFAAFCFDKLNSYAIVNDTPDVEENSNFHPVGLPNWDYRFLADDYQGMGVDVGFIKQKGFHNNAGKSKVQLSALASVLSLQSLPEEAFGEAVSNCILFGLQENRAQALQGLLQADVTPVIETFLQDEEIFIYLTVAKEIGYYNALLIKSKTDVTERLDAFQSVFDPNN